MAQTIRSIRFPFAIDAARGTLAEETDHAAHVEQMMLQVLFTAPGERANRPDFGCGIGKLVFSPNSEAAANLLKVTIRSSLDKWLGTLIRVDDVSATPNGERFDIRIVWLLRTHQERRILNLEVTP